MMLITQDLLIDITKDYINRLLRQNNDIVACYLTGSVLGDQAFIGGSTDIDLVVVHKEDPPAPAKFDALKAIFRWILFITINRFTPFIAECDRTAGWAMPCETMMASFTTPTIGLNISRLAWMRSLTLPKTHTRGR